MPPTSHLTRAPSMADVIRAAIDTQMSNVHVCLPGKVVRYDASKQQVDVQPLIKQAYMDEEDARVVESLPVVSHCPVLFPSAGGFRITFPIANDDVGFLLFSEASLDKWLAQGGEVDPSDDRRSALSDGIFLPGGRDFAHPLQDAPMVGMSVGKDGGLTIHLESGQITIGESSGGSYSPVGLGDNIESRLAALELFAASHIHSGGTVAGNTGSATPAATLNVPPLSVQSGNIRVRK